MKKNLLAMAVMATAVMSAQADSFKLSDRSFMVSPQPGEVEVLGRVEIGLEGDYSAAGATPYYTFDGVEQELNYVDVDAFMGQTYIDFRFVDLNVSDGLTEAGTYVLVVPAGFVADAEGNTNEAEEFSYTIGGGGSAGNYSAVFAPVNPTCFNEWTVTIEGADYADIAEPGAPVTIVNPNGDTVTTMYPEMLDDSSLVYGINFGSNATRVEMLSVPGEYTITIPAGMFILDPEDFDYDTSLPGNSPEFTYTATLVSSTPDVEYVLTPGSELSQTSLSSFDLSFLNVSNVEVNDGASAILVSIEGEGGVSELSIFVTELGTVSLATSEPVTEAGAYVLSISEGSFLLTMTDGTVVSSPAIEAVYTVAAAADEIAFVTEPAANATVESFGSFRIIFPEATEVLDMSAFALVAESGSGEAINLYDDFMGEGSNFISYILEEAAVVDYKSSWSITIPAGSIEVDGKPFQGAVITFDVDPMVSVEGIAADGVYTVYNMQGIRVLNAADASSVKALPAGLYIVNGKKTAIR